MSESCKRCGYTIVAHARAKIRTACERFPEPTTAVFDAAASAWVAAEAAR